MVAKILVQKTGQFNSQKKISPVFKVPKNTSGFSHCSAHPIYLNDCQSSNGESAVFDLKSLLKEDSCSKPRPQAISAHRNQKKNAYFVVMYSSIEIEQKLKVLKPELAATYSVSRIGYFGSYAREDQNAGSDLDVLVEFSKPIGWKFFTLETFLAKSLGLKVDLVTPATLKDRIKESILNQVRYI